MGKSEVDLLRETMTEARQLLADIRGVQKDIRNEVREAKRLLATSFEERLHEAIQDAINKSDAAMVRAIHKGADDVVGFFTELRDGLLYDKTSIGQLAHDWAMLRHRIMAEPTFVEMVQGVEPKQLAALALNALQNAGIPLPEVVRNVRPEDVIVTIDPVIRDV
jgi:phosphoglycerate-specific signal transduction histidine kinase